ncbi:MAG: hypothetical protein IKQ46_15845 [Bacteroidales bacterium]|nr:hypothetical protein [Bacteroidales bacterium]
MASRKNILIISILAFLLNSCSTFNEFADKNLNGNNTKSDPNNPNSYLSKVSEEYIINTVKYLSDKAVNVVDDGQRIVYYTRKNKEAFRFQNDSLILPPKGQRYEQKEYLKKSYCRKFLRNFKREGCGFVALKEWTVNNEKYSNWPPRKFVGLASDMDNIITDYQKSEKNLNILNDRLSLGVDSNYLSNKEIYYVKISKKDKRFKYSLPSGNENGAYDGSWIPGGRTKGGIREAALIGSEQIKYKYKDMQSFLDNFDKNNQKRLK